MVLPERKDDTEYNHIPNRRMVAQLAAVEKKGGGGRIIREKIGGMSNRTNRNSEALVW